MVIPCCEGDNSGQGRDGDGGALASLLWGFYPGGGGGKTEGTVIGLRLLEDCKPGEGCTHAEIAPAIHSACARECETRAIERDDLDKEIRDSAEGLFRYSSRSALPRVQVALIV